MKNKFKTRGNPEILNLNMTEDLVIEEFIETLDTFI